MLPLPPNVMPMKAAADDAAGAPPMQLPNLPMPPAGAVPPPMPPPAMPPMPSGPDPSIPPAGGPAPMAPAPMGAPMMPPSMGIDPKHIQTFTQDDGTIVGFIPTPDGGQHIVGVHPPFKLPKGQKPAAGAPPMDLSRAALPMQ